jgi:hypothetical protein
VGIELDLEEGIGEMERSFTDNQGTTKAKAILHKIGDQAPYFSLTGEEYEKRRLVSCGCMHDRLLEIWPDLKPIADLHLSDIDGVPMHAKANGWYWLEGSFNGLGSRFHGASGDSGKSPQECFRIFKEHGRFSDNYALVIWRELKSLKDHYAEMGEPTKALDAMKARWADICADQRPRWKKEAQETIEKFDLEVVDD